MKRIASAVILSFLVNSSEVGTVKAAVNTKENERGRRLHAAGGLKKHTQLEKCKPSGKSDWTYNNVCTYTDDKQLPPDDWSQSYPECGGSRQSPIDIDSSNASLKCEESVISGNMEYNSGSCSYGDLTFNPSIKHWEVIFDKNACYETPYMMVEDQKFILEKFQFHSKSEHTFKGVREDAELHMVHYNNVDRKDVLIIAVILDTYDQITQPTELVNYLTRLSTAADLHDHSRPASFPFDVSDDQEVANPYNLLPEEENYYAYTGSLTTPPCTENVRWMIVEMPKMISSTELKLLKNQIKFKNESLVDNEGANVRPVQKLNDRIVYGCN